MAAFFDMGAQFWLRQSRDAAHKDPRLAGAAAQLSAANEMLAAASNPLDSNYMKAWMGQDIYVRRTETPQHLFPKR